MLRIKAQSDGPRDTLVRGGSSSLSVPSRVDVGWSAAIHS